MEPSTQTQPPFQQEMATELPLHHKTMLLLFLTPPLLLLPHTLGVQGLELSMQTLRPFLQVMAMRLHLQDLVMQ